MNMLLVDGRDFTCGGRVRITGRRFEQLRDVIKLVPGKNYRAGLLGGRRGYAELTGYTEDAAEFLLKLNEDPPPPLPVTLLCALPRPQTLKKVLHGAATMGVKTIYFINAFKVDKGYWQTPMLEEAFLDRELRQALEQSADTVLPHIEFRPRFKPFVEDELPGMLRDCRGYFGDPGAAQMLPHGCSGPVLLAVGPEGGFTEFEEEALRKAGLTGASLGPHILRTEFAVVALLARLSA